MKIRLNETETAALLDDLCVGLGFCLPQNLTQRILNNPPTSIERFANVVYRGDGLDPTLQSDLYEAVRLKVTEAFERAASSKTERS